MSGGRAAAAQDFVVAPTRPPPSGGRAASETKHGSSANVRRTSIAEDREVILVAVALHSNIFHDSSSVNGIKAAGIAVAAMNGGDGRRARSLASSPWPASSSTLGGRHGQRLARPPAVKFKWAAVAEVSPWARRPSSPTSTELFESPPAGYRDSDAEGMSEAGTPPMSTTSRAVVDKRRRRSTRRRARCRYARRAGLRAGWPSLATSQRTRRRVQLATTLAVLPRGRARRGRRLAGGLRRRGPEAMPVLRQEVTRSLRGLPRRRRVGRRDSSSTAPTPPASPAVVVTAPTTPQRRGRSARGYSLARRRGRSSGPPSPRCSRLRLLASKRRPAAACSSRHCPTPFDSASNRGDRDEYDGRGASVR